VKLGTKPKRQDILVKSFRMISQVQDQKSFTVLSSQIIQWQKKSMLVPG